MEITISSGAIAAMGVAMGISLGLPFLYILFNRKRLRLAPLVLGLAAYVLVNYLLLGVVMSNLLSRAVPDAPALLAILTALINTLGIAGGHYVALRYLKRSSRDAGQPLSYGLGYTCISLVLVAGAQMFSNISLCTAVNNNGFEKVATTVDDPDALYALLQQIVDTPAYIHVLGGVEMILYFTLMVATSILVWYAVEHPRSMEMGIAAAALFVSMLALELYGQGILPSALLADGIYALASVGCAVFAYRVYRKNEGDVVYQADPVQRI